MAKVKGIQVNAVMTFLTKRFGEHRVQPLVEALAAEDRVLLPATILDSSWYPFDVWRPIRRISRSLATKKDAGLAIDMGKFIADFCFSGAYKSLLVNDPIKQVEKFSWVHDFFYRDAHKLESLILSPTSCQVIYRFEEGVRPARSTCASTLGFWMRTIELAGGKNAKAAHDKCIIDRAECCEYFLEWQ